MEEARAQLRELEGIQIETDSLKKRLKTLSNREKVLRGQLEQYCIETRKPGVRYNNTVVMLETREVRARKKKAEQRASQVQVLRARGINADDSLINALEEARRGEAVETQRLRVQRKTTR